MNRDLAFDHEADGWGWEAGAAVCFNLAEHHAVELGAKCLTLNAADGTETNHFGDGTVSRDSLDWARTERTFFFLGYTFRF